MANRVTISSLGPRPLQGHPIPSGQEAVDRMIEFWKQNLEKVLPEKPDLIVVPEACDRYPQMSMEERYDYYRTRGEQVRDFFARVAKEHHCYIAYSAARELPGDVWVNSTQIIDRAGQVAGVYNKNHTVVTETLDAGIRVGRQAPIVECDFGRVACVICFDLNFDALRVQYAAARPDLIVFCSMYHGGFMQTYWAYSCRAHFVGACAGLPCNIISPVGHEIAASTNYFDTVTATVNLDCRVAHLDFNGGRFNAMRQKYADNVKVFDPGLLGSVLISSETDEVTIDELVEEFEIELLDDYWTRSLAMRENPDLWAPQ
jgi:predicted amidohydrolase